MRPPEIRPHIEAFALETFSVVLGIVLALGSNAWHDRVVHQRQAREALASIRAELSANRSSLDAKLPYHMAMHDSLAALVARTHTKEVQGGQLAIANWSGLQPTQLLDDAWQTARSTQALEYLPYDEILALSRTYAIQQRIAELNRAFFGAVYTPQFASGGVFALGAMGSYLQDLAAAETRLSSQYDGEIKRIGKTLGGP
jgi:hypothetical protein